MVFHEDCIGNEITVFGTLTVIRTLVPGGHYFNVDGSSSDLCLTDVDSAKWLVVSFDGGDTWRDIAISKRTK